MQSKFYCRRAHFSFYLKRSIFTFRYFVSNRRQELATISFMFMGFKQIFRLIGKMNPHLKEEKEMCFSDSINAKLKCI